jgi:hypothetical protein
MTTIRNSFPAGLITLFCALALGACGGEEPAASSSMSVGADVPPGAPPAPGAGDPAAVPGAPAAPVAPGSPAVPADPSSPAPTPGPAMPAPGGDFVAEEEAFIVEEGDSIDPTAGGFVPSEKVDLLFVIDNSSSMADKQEIFRQAIPDMIDQMVNPPCIVAETKDFIAFPEGGVACPSGTNRIFNPVTDIHIGVISSSLGPRGTVADEIPLGCSEAAGENDRSWLLGRIRPELTAESYQNWGFLVWDPKQQAVPPGDPDLATIVAKTSTQVSTVGEDGCGYEAPLEAAYRFLSDPDPYESLQRVPCPGRPDAGDLCVEPVGVDQDLLQQRAAFLRPDSVVVVMFLTDENDCSLRAKGQGFMAMINRVLDNGTAACDTNPNDMCCRPCGAGLPEGCDADPATNGCSDPADDIAEARPLRCFDQQRRFGVSFLRSTDVYVGGYVFSRVADRAGEAQANPLFTESRGREKIFVVGIIGVPWQDTATPETVNAQAEGLFDLIEASEVNWAQFLPTGGAFPTDPFNVEAMGMRTGSHPITGEAVGGPGTWNSINGHDRSLFVGDNFDDDLQYSCIFPLNEPRDCSLDASYSGCDCVTESDAEGNVYNYYEGNPLCYDQASATYGTTQYYAKAYPGPRMLELLEGVSCPPDLDEGAACTDQSVLASICPRQTTDPTKQDFGYRPVIRALLLNVAERLVR